MMAVFQIHKKFGKVKTVLFTAPNIGINEEMLNQWSNKRYLLIRRVNDCPKAMWMRTYAHCIYQYVHNLYAFEILYELHEITGDFFRSHPQ